MDLKKPLSYEEQITRLEEHNLEVQDRNFAIEFLSRVNYYRFTGYALQFRKSPHDSDYIAGITFELVAEIYRFDCDLRHLLHKQIEILEIFYRTQIAYHFSMSKCFLPPHNQHYDLTIFFDQENAKTVINNFNNKRKYHKDSLIYQHHQRKYNNQFPLWVIAEMLSFSDLSKLYSCMYNSEQNAIAQAVGTGHSVLKNHLHCLSVLRNKCAHAARLYNTNFMPSAQLPRSFLREYREVMNDSLFTYILVVVKRLPKDSQKLEFISELTDLIENYQDSIDLKLLNFPDDFVQILKDNRI